MYVNCSLLETSKLVKALAQIFNCVKLLFCEISNCVIRFIWQSNIVSAVAWETSSSVNWFSQHSMTERFSLLSNNVLNWLFWQLIHSNCVLLERSKMVNWLKMQPNVVKAVFWERSTDDT